MCRALDTSRVRAQAERPVFFLGERSCVVEFHVLLLVYTRYTEIGH